MDSNIKLSVLICTVVGREARFEKLYNFVAKQAEGKPVEILFEKDNKEISVGAKRQKLLERAKGEYICYIDDDDFVSEKYIDSILKALDRGADCVGFLIDCEIETRGGKQEKSSAVSSLKYKDWGDNIDGFRYVRSIYHKTPVKREIALKVGFEDKRYKEDYPYSIGVTKLCQSEVFINEILYYYRKKYEGSHNQRYGIK